MLIDFDKFPTYEIDAHLGYDDILKGIFEFVECYPEGEQLILVFKNNNETIEVWDAPNNIWEI